MAIKQYTEDSKLIEKLRKGDLEAFDQVFKKYGDRLFGFAFGYLKSKEETEGLVQDVFLKIWENRKDLKDEYSLRPYLFTIAFHNICRFFRKKKIHDMYVDEVAIKADYTISLDEQLEYQFAIEQVDLLIDKLAGKQKEIFIKSRRERKSTREIAKEMNLAPGTVDNHISAALKFLRRNLSESNFLLLLFYAVFIQ